MEEEEVISVGFTPIKVLDIDWMEVELEELPLVHKVETACGTKFGASWDTWEPIKFLH